MLEPKLLTSQEWGGTKTSSFKIIKEPEDIILFQTSLIVFRGDIPELDLIYPHDSYGFYFSIWSNGGFFGATPDGCFFHQSGEEPMAVLKSIKKCFPEYGSYLTDNYKQYFSSRIPK